MRFRGIEPRDKDWKSFMLPLHQKREKSGLLELNQRPFEIC